MADDPEYAHHPPAAASKPKRFNLARARSKAAEQARTGRGRTNAVGFDRAAVDAGEAAREAGHSRDSNPHPPGSDAHDHWDFGFGE